MRIGNLHIISEEELQRLYRVFRPANLDEKNVLEGQLADLHLQLENLQRDYDAAIEAGDRAVDRADRSVRIRRAVLLERKRMIEQIELLEQQVKDLTDAVQSPPEKDEDKKKDQNVVQNIVDKAAAKIGFSDDLTASSVQAYIERELRLRGDSSADQILAEVLAGGYDEEDDATDESEEKI